MKRLFLPLMTVCAFFQSCSNYDIENPVGMEQRV